MPSLEEISKPNTKEKLKCEIFQGLEGLKTALKDLVKAKTDYKIIGIKEEYEKILGYFNEQGTIKLNQSKVKEEAIIEEGVIVKKLKNSIHKKIKKGIKNESQSINHLSDNHIGRICTKGFLLSAGSRNLRECKILYVLPCK